MLVFSNKWQCPKKCVRFSFVLPLRLGVPKAGGEVVTVDATSHLGNVFTRKSTSIQLMKKLCTLTLLSSQDAEYDRLKSPRASARNAKLETATLPTPTTRTETIVLFTFMFFEKEGALLLGKTIQKYAHQLIKTCLT